MFISHVTVLTLPLFQLPGEVDGLALQRGIHVVSYHDRSLPVYKISVPSHLVLALPSDATSSSSDMHMSSPSDHGSCEMEIPAVVLDGLWPNLAQTFSQSTGLESVGEDARSMSAETTIDLTMDAPCFDAEVIDLEHARSTPEKAVIDLTMDVPCFDTEVIDLTGED